MLCSLAAPITSLAIISRMLKHSGWVDLFYKLLCQWLMHSLTDGYSIDEIKASTSGYTVQRMKANILEQHICICHIPKPCLWDRLVYYKQASVFWGWMTTKNVFIVATWAYPLQCLSYTKLPYTLLRKCHWVIQFISISNITHSVDTLWIHNLLVVSFWPNTIVNVAVVTNRVMKHLTIIWPALKVTWGC